MAETYKILVVDDEPVILDSARRILGSEKFRVLTCLDAESASQILAEEAPDVVVSDLMLPGASGIDLLESAGEQDPTLLTIITTGYSTVDNAVASLKKGAFDFLPKPFTYDELLSCVERACRAIELRLTLKTRVPSIDAFHLGAQSWARPEEGGSALLGVTSFLLRTIDSIDRIEFPDRDADLQQGGRLVLLHTHDRMTHNIWSPLSGRVLECNDRFRKDPDAVRTDPAGAGWLVRILPSSPDRELSNLTTPT